MTHVIHDEFFSGSHGRTSSLPIGFTPIRNKRIDAAIAAAALKLLDEGKLQPSAVRIEAVRQVARTLPLPAFGRRFRLPKPSKSDSAAYRKQACAAA